MPSVNKQSNNSLNKCISESEVKKHVQRMKNGKAISVDGIANEIIKNDASIKMLTRLYNIFYSENIIPELWKRSLICPIHQEGAKKID